MKLTFLGSGGSSVSAKRACPSLMVNETMLFDAGPGSLRNLRASGLNPDRVSEVFISHCHADHICDLIPFLWAIQIDGRKNPLQIYGPPGFNETFEKLLQCTCTSEGFFKFPLVVSELDFGQSVANVRTCATSHSVPTLGFRVEQAGKSLCYSADTTYSPAVVELSRNADLLLHEATFLEDQLSIAQLTKHSTAKMAGRAGREAQAKRLSLFHIPPPNEHREDEFRAQTEQEYGGRVTIGTDLASIEF